MASISTSATCWAMSIFDGRSAGGSLPWLSMLQAGWERICDLRQQGRYDALMLHCKLFPLLPGWAERGLLREPYLYDFDDALRDKPGRAAEMGRAGRERVERNYSLRGNLPVLAEVIRATARRG